MSCFTTTLKSPNDILGMSLLLVQSLHVLLPSSSELSPEIRTLTYAAICSLMIFNLKEISHVKTEATAL